jgi:hypothetical protein
MKFVEFPQVTSILAKNQPEYTPIPVHCKKKIGVFTASNGEKFNKEFVNAMICCLELTDEQIAELVKTKRIWYQQLLFGNNFQPMFLSTKDPFIEENKQHWPADD